MFRFSLTALLIVLALQLATAHAASYIVEFDDAAHAKRALGQSSPHDDFHAHAKRNGIAYVVKHDYDHPHVFLGVALNLHDDAHLASLSAAPYVKAVHRDTVIQLDSPVFAPALGERHELDKRAPVDYDAIANFPPHVMTRVNELHAEGVFGQGVLICNIDTGIDYTHPALGGCFGPGCKVRVGKNFVDDQPDDEIMDCNGHGTHVAGIYGALPNPAGFQGVAPNATLGGYRAFDCGGSSKTSAIIASMLQAAKDDCQVINISGGDFGGFSDGLKDTIASRISQRENRVFAISMGNSASEGLFFAQSAGSGSDVIAISSVDVSAVSAWPAVTNTGQTVLYQSPLPFGGSPGWGGAAFAGDVPVYRVSDDIDGDCAPVTRDLSDGIVLVNSGVASCSTADFTASLAANTRFVFSISSELPDFAFTIPTATGVSATISHDDGELLYDLLDKGAVTVRLPYDLQRIVNNATAGQTAETATFGPAWTPTSSFAAFAAPGQFYTSTWPMKTMGYATIGGTSQSTPHAAGAIALYIAAKGLTRETTSPNLIREVFATMANPVENSYTDELDTVARTGTGLIDAYCAVHTEVLASPAQLLLGDDTTNGVPQPIIITNNGDTDVTYRIRHETAPTHLAYNPQTNRYNAPTNPPVIVAQGAKATLSAQTITVPAHSSRQVVASFTPPSGDDLAGTFPVYSGFLHFSSNSTCDPTVSYFGIIGKMADMPLLRNSVLLFDANNHPMAANAVVDPAVGQVKPGAPLISGSPFVAYDLVDEDAVIPSAVHPSISAAPPPASKRDAHHSPIAHNGAKMRRTPMSKRQAGEHLDSDPSMKANLAAARHSLATAFAPYAAQLKLRGALSAVDALHSPRWTAATVTADYFVAMGWTVVDEATGETIAVPDGRYRVLARALRLMSDPTVASSYEAALSAVFEVKRS